MQAIFVFLLLAIVGTQAVLSHVPLPFRNGIDGCDLRSGDFLQKMIKELEGTM